MPWHTLTFCAGNILTGSQMNQVVENFTALAQGLTGAPAINVNSLVVTGIGCFANINIGSGTIQADTASLNTLNVGSMFSDNFGTQQLDVNSGITADVGSLDRINLSGAPSGTPETNTIYNKNICRAFICFKGTSTVSIYNSFNITSLVRNSLGIYSILFDRNFANVFYVPMGAGDGGTNPHRATIGYDASSKEVGGIVITTGDTNVGGRADPEEVSISFMGDQ